MTFKELLEKKDYIFLDGAMGTMLQKKKISIPAVPEELNITNPEVIQEIHRANIEAGSDIIYANTFNCNRKKVNGSKYSLKELIEAGIKNANTASKGTDTLVALDISPIGELLEPTGTLKFEDAYEIFKEIIEYGKDADLIVIETMTDLYEVRAAILAAKENSNLPVICTMTYELSGRTFTGCSVSAMALTCDALGVDALGVNCSLGPKDLYPIVAEIKKWTDLPVIFKPNAGLPDPMTNLFSLGADEFSDEASAAIKYGVKGIGGCCGTTPLHIKKLIEKVTKLKNTVEIESAEKADTAVCTATKTVVISEPRIIGERINPTGKKRFKEALRNNDMNYILNQAIEQINAGADILDVNVGLPKLDEKAMMVSTVKAIQAVSDIPLQLDSTDPEVLDAALRIYNGKPIINSVNGESESMEKILPVAAKYGTALICLTLDEGGIPKTAERRIEIVKKIMDNAVNNYGIKKENLIIDCLTLTASAEQQAVFETLKAVNIVTNEFGLKTCLGVSNISFGLPNRGLITSSFLTMALYAGLSLPIINPNKAEIMDAVRAYKLLANLDKNAVNYVSVYADYEEKKADAPVKAVKKTESKDSDSKENNNDLKFAIKKGLKDDGMRIVGEMLETTEPMVIVNDYIIPALDEVGALFEKGKIFLPQLILSAGVVQSSFGLIKKSISESGSAPVSKGKVVLCTVKGDVHDIGKNIVKVLLENYGFEVIDLGKDVAPELVRDTVKKEHIKLAGLSALMTTTLKSMEETIEIVHRDCPWCKVVVGGAVLTPDYAKQINADFYAKDAKETVDIAKKVV